jgi:threonine/homoserine/homoserine lactone efflux protein
VPTLSTLVVFAAVAVGFTAIPGPTSLFVLGRGISAGVRPAIAGAAGCAAGTSVYVVATAVGLSALIASSQTVFAALHYFGAAYLAFLGLRAIFGPAGEIWGDSPGGGPQRLWPSFRQGMLVELSNPKVALFFLALFPQFVEASQGPTWSQVLVLGGLFVATGFLTDSCYALGSGALRHWLQGRPWLMRRQPQLTGALYLGLGAWVAASGANARQS